MENVASKLSSKLRFGSQELSEGSGGVYQHINSYNGKIQAMVPLAGAKEIDMAVDAASEAFLSWKNWPGAKRRDILLKLADLVAANANEFAMLAALDTGTPVIFSRTGPDAFISWTRYYAGWADKLDGTVSSTYSRDGQLGYSTYEPIGVIGIIITWNAPLNSIGMKLSPALAAGNTVVVKPSEFTPFAADLFARLVKEAGFPDGVINILAGSVEAGEALVKNKKVKKISFTGGPNTARKIMALCSEQLKPSIHELGGKSANIIFPDANLEAAVALTTRFPLQVLSGQGCALPTRMLVHESVFSKVKEIAKNVASSIKMGNPLDKNTEMGPVVNNAALNRIMGMIERAKTEYPSSLLIGGNRKGGEFKDGFFIEPTIFADIDHKSEIAQNEVFGPVLCMVPFKTEEEAIELANDTEYGLAAFVQTANVQRAHRIAEQLEAGGVYINGGSMVMPGTPFGGLGLSGFGREGGRMGIDEFLRPKTIQIGAL